MKKETFQKAKSINTQIELLEQGLKSFEFEDGTSRQPILLVEHLDEECDGRAITKLPMQLNEALIKSIKQSLKEEIERLTNEFNSL